MACCILGFWIASTPVASQDHDNLGHEVFENISVHFHTTFLIAGLSFDIWGEHPDRWNRTLRVADALIVTTAATALLKATTLSPRPDTRVKNSFPSGHTSSAFAVATIQASFHPREAVYWYTGAALIGVSRVGLGRHRWADVIGGAAVGYLVGRWALSSDGLLLVPLWGNSVGAALAVRF